MKNKIFEEATEIFLRLLKGETLELVDDLRALAAARRLPHATPTGSACRGVRSAVRRDPARAALALPEPEDRPAGIADGSAAAARSARTIAATQIFANTILPVGVFNLSITPGDEIEKTNERMRNGISPRRRRLARGG